MSRVEGRKIHSSIQKFDRPLDEPVVKEHKDPEKEREEEEKAANRKKIPPTLVSFMGTYLQKTLNAFSSTPKKAMSFAEKERLLKNVTNFKKVLQKITEEDLSQNQEFAAELSSLWILLIDDMFYFESFDTKGFAAIDQVHQFIEMLNTFPIGENHTFGFYLSEEVGKKWLPLPFIKALKEIHLRYENDPSNSVLEEWITHLEQITPESKEEE